MDKSGYQEVEHTADVEMQVWAPDLAGLLAQAARGMYDLCGVQYDLQETIIHNISFHYLDREFLLVEFLNELLYLMIEDGLVFDQYQIEMKASCLEATLGGGKMISLAKEIKAVTYHKLLIEETDRGLEARLVFDI